MKAEEDYGTINNRVFEATPCGSGLSAEYSDVLDKEFGNSILSYTIDSKDITHKIESVLHNQSGNIVSLEIENFLGNFLQYPHYTKLIIMLKY